MTTYNTLIKEHNKNKDDIVGINEQLADMENKIVALSTFDIGIIQSDINCDFIEPLRGIRQGRIVTISCFRVKFKTLSNQYSYTALGRINEEYARPKTAKKWIITETSTGATFILLIMTDGLIQVGCWDRKITATDEIGFTITYNLTN